MPFLVTLRERDGRHAAPRDRFLRASDLGDGRRERRVEDGRLGRGRGRAGRARTARSATAGARRAPGAGTSTSGEIDPALTLLGRHDELVEVTLPRFDGGETEGGTTMRRGVPARAGRRPARDHRLRPRARPVRRRPRGPARRVAARLRRRRRALHAGLAGADHRRRRRPRARGSRASSPTTPSAPRAAR